MTLSHTSHPTPQTLWRATFNLTYFRYGLHLLRCALSERITDALRRAEGLHLHDDYDDFMENGILVKDFTKMNDEDLHYMLRMVSGLDSEMISDLVWEQREVHHVEGDSNAILHVDTYRYMLY